MRFLGCPSIFVSGVLIVAPLLPTTVFARSSHFFSIIDSAFGRTVPTTVFDPDGVLTATTTDPESLEDADSSSSNNIALNGNTRALDESFFLHTLLVNRDLAGPSTECMEASDAIFADDPKLEELTTQMQDEVAFDESSCKAHRPDYQVCVVDGSQLTGHDEFRRICHEAGGDGLSATFFVVCVMDHDLLAGPVTGEFYLRNVPHCFNGTACDNDDMQALEEEGGDDIAQQAESSLEDGFGGATFDCTAKVTVKRDAAAAPNSRSFAMWLLLTTTVVTSLVGLV